MQKKVIYANDVSKRCIKYKLLVTTDWYETVSYGKKKTWASKKSNYQNIPFETFVKYIVIAVTRALTMH